jgi:hypothetical protein
MRNSLNRSLDLVPSSLLELQPPLAACVIDRVQADWDMPKMMTDELVTHRLKGVFRVRQIAPMNAGPIH